MQTDCIPDLFGFEPVEGRPVVTAFDGGSITSDAGAMLLGATDRAIGLIDRFAACFHDARRQELIEHEVATLIGQRVFGLAAGYEDLIDHDQLRHDPAMAILAGNPRVAAYDIHTSFGARLTSYSGDSRAGGWDGADARGVRRRTPGKRSYAGGRRPDLAG